MSQSVSNNNKKKGLLNGGKLMPFDSGGVLLSNCELLISKSPTANKTNFTVDLVEEEGDEIPSVCLFTFEFHLLKKRFFVVVELKRSRYLLWW